MQCGEMSSHVLKCVLKCTIFSTDVYILNIASNKALAE